MRRGKSENNLDIKLDPFGYIQFSNIQWPVHFYQSTLTNGWPISVAGPDTWLQPFAIMNCTKQSTQRRANYSRSEWGGRNSVCAQVPSGGDLGSDAHIRTLPTFKSYLLVCGHRFLKLFSFLRCSWPHKKPFSNQPYPLDETWKYLLSLLILPEFKILEKTNKTKSQNEEKIFNFLRPFRKIQINIYIHTLRRKKATGNLKIMCVNLSTSFVILAIFSP